MINKLIQTALCCVCVQSKFDHLEISLDRSKSYYNIVRNRFFAPENRIETIFFIYNDTLLYSFLLLLLLSII